MHAIRVASATLLGGVTALSLAVPAWPAATAGHHDDRFDVRVEPTTIAAGGQVTLSASGCEGETRVSSGIFDTVRIHEDSGTARATVDGDAKQGAQYAVTFACEDGRTRTVDLTIAGPRPAPLDPSVHHGVQAGAGGSAGGFDMRQTAFGAVLIAGALGVAYRRSRRSPGDGGS